MSHGRVVTLSNFLELVPVDCQADGLTDRQQVQGVLGQVRKEKDYYGRRVEDVVVGGITLNKRLLDTIDIQWTPINIAFNGCQFHTVKRVERQDALFRHLELTGLPELGIFDQVTKLWAEGL